MRTTCAIAWLAALALAQLAAGAAAQQRPDPDAVTSVGRPAFEGQPGPRVAIDGGHQNFHTLEGRFAPFAALLRNDGFEVTALTAPLAHESLDPVDVLVIANALHAVNVDNWALPTPSAFGAEEITAVKSWVQRGGALLLIADHLPFAGAAQDLAAAFGLEFVNGFALTGSGTGADVFTMKAGTLRDHAITRGRGADEAVTAVATFTGSAFAAPPDARPLIVLPDGFVLLLPSVAWQFDEQTPWLPAAGHLQAAALRHGTGRVAVFAEAGMFTAQLGGGEPPARIGFNAPEAAQNRQFILNTLRWLAGALPD
jgi:hypothetical protein